MTCDEIGAGIRPSRWQTSASIDGIEVREGADRAGDLADAHASRGRARTRSMSRSQLGVPQRQLQAERHHLGVHAVGAADHRRVLVLVGARLDRLAERRHVLEDQVAGLDHLQRLRGVDHVG